MSAEQDRKTAARKLVDASIGYVEESLSHRGRAERCMTFAEILSTIAGLEGDLPVRALFLRRTIPVPRA